MLVLQFVRAVCTLLLLLELAKTKILHEKLSSQSAGEYMFKSQLFLNC